MCLTEQKIELVAILPVRCLEQFDTDYSRELNPFFPSYNFQKKKNASEPEFRHIQTVLYLEAFCAAAKRQMIK